MVCLAGFAVQGVFGLAAGVLISAIIGIGYGRIKKDRLIFRYALIALLIDLAGITAFYVALKASDM